MFPERLATWRKALPKVLLLMPAVLQLSPPPRSHPAMSTASAVGVGCHLPSPSESKAVSDSASAPEPTSWFSMLPRLPSRGRMFSRMNVLESIFWYAVSVPGARPVFLFLQTLPQPRDGCTEPFPTPLSVRPRGQLALDLGRNTDTVETRKMQKPLPGPSHRLFPQTQWGNWGSSGGFAMNDSSQGCSNKALGAAMTPLNSLQVNLAL